MPLDPITGSAIIGSAGALGGGVFGYYANRQNIKYQEKTNEENRNFQREMYDRQRQDAIADWEAANRYNSPIEQMNRLRQAGLNPNLVYGKGADNTAAMIRSSSPGGSNQEAPKMSTEWANNMLNQFMQVQMQMAQRKQLQASTDNMLEQKRVIEKDALLRDAQILSTLAGARNKDADTWSKQFDNDMKLALQDITKRMAETNLKQAGLNLMRTNYEIKNLDAKAEFTIQENIRQGEMNQAKLRQIVQAIAESKARQAKTEADTENAVATKRLLNDKHAMNELEIIIKGYEADLAKEGINKNDPTWQRQLVKRGNDVVELINNWIRTYIPEYGW